MSGVMLGLTISAWSLSFAVIEQSCARVAMAASPIATLRAYVARMVKAEAK